MFTFVKSPAAQMLFLVPAPFRPLNLHSVPLGEMESALSLSNSGTDLCSHYLDVTVVWELEVINTSHHTGQVVVGAVWWLTRLADDGEHGCESFEA